MCSDTAALSRALILPSSIKLPDDRHVVAVAIHGGSEGKFDAKSPMTASQQLKSVSTAGILTLSAGKPSLRAK